MPITIVELIVPSGPSTLAEASLLLLRLFLGICFIRHGWPKLRNLKTGSMAEHTYHVSDKIEEAEVESRPAIFIASARFRT